MDPNGKCRSCDAAVVWAETAKRKKIPLDPEPRADGNVRIAGRLADGTIIVAALAPGEGSYVSHFASCKDAAQHRRKK